MERGGGYGKIGEECRNNDLLGQNVKSLIN